MPPPLRAYAAKISPQKASGPLTDVVAIVRTSRRKYNLATRSRSSEVFARLYGSAFGDNSAACLPPRAPHREPPCFVWGRNAHASFAGWTKSFRVKSLAMKGRVRSRSPARRWNHALHHGVGPWKSRRVPCRVLRATHARARRARAWRVRRQAACNERRGIGPNARCREFASVI